MEGKILQLGELSGHLAALLRMPKVLAAEVVVVRQQGEGWSLQHPLRHVDLCEVATVLYGVMRPVTEPLHLEMPLVLDVCVSRLFLRYYALRHAITTT